MDMGSGMSGGNDNGFMPLSPAGVDFSNETQAFNFLQDILDDSFFQVVANRYATYFWYGVVVFVGIATAVNVGWSVLLQSRMRSASSGHARPARPGNFFTVAVSTMTAIVREATYVQVTPNLVAKWLHVPPSGSLTLIHIYLGFILGLVFINNNYPGAQHDQAIGIRSGWLAVAQLPLLILLSGKANLIGLLTGVSYERLSVYHRWVARGLLLLATMHLGFQTKGWNDFGLVRLEWSTDTCPPTGLAAYVILLWMNVTTLRPFRSLSYGFFVFQHILTFFGFIIAVMEHLPSTALYTRVYVWIAIGLYTFDRCIRAVRYTFNNISFKTASIEPLDDVAVSIKIPDARLKPYGPGAHVRLRFWDRGFWHSHPATIISHPPSGGDTVCILRVKGWLTRRLLESAKGETHSQDGGPRTNYSVLVSGPYLSMHNNFAAFDTVLFIAGGTGITFNLSCLTHLGDRAKEAKLPVRNVTFVWVIKEAHYVHWISQQLQKTWEDLDASRINLTVRVYVTSHRESKLSGSPEKATVLHSTRWTDSDDDSSSRDNNANFANEVARGLSKVESFYGRPNVSNIIRQPIESAEGESAVCVCGPRSLIIDTRRAVVSLSDQRAVHKGTGAQGIYLHAASQHDM